MIWIFTGVVIGIVLVWMSFCAGVYFTAERMKDEEPDMGFRIVHIYRIEEDSQFIASIYQNEVLYEAKHLDNFEKMIINTN